MVNSPLVKLRGILQTLGAGAFLRYGAGAMLGQWREQRNRLQAELDSKQQDLSTRLFPVRLFRQD